MSLLMTIDTELTNSQFNKIRKRVLAICGINLKSGKEQLVRARLAKRLRKLGMKDFKEYLNYVDEDTANGELSSMIDALTTNKTDFFRESKHFDYLKKSILPEIPNKTFRIWSAGCSSGEEPYSLSMIMNEHVKNAADNVRILATDISSTVLLKARRGVYHKDMVRTIPPALKDRSFSFMRSQPGYYQVSKPVRSLVHFAHLNLMDEWPMKGPFDIIFCRNVMIYFDKTVQKKLVNRFSRYLTPGGYLFVGHSESLAGIKHDLNYIQPAVYKK